MDIARTGGGLAADLWSTEYALSRCLTCRESNPLGQSKGSRLWLKVGTSAALIATTDRLRRNGHPGWAKWVGRGAMVAQLGFATNNVIRARRAGP